MSIYDRDYIKENDSDAISSARRFSAVQILIGINVLVWLTWMIGRPRDMGNPELLDFMAKHFMVSHHGVFEIGYVHTLITAAFSHIQLPHILFNMMTLYFFGTIVEQRFGFRNMFAAYILCGMGGSLLHATAYYMGPFGQFGPALGASSSTMGLVLMVAILMPHSIWRLFGVLPVPLWLLASSYIIMDISGVLSGGTGIANFAHIGGTLVGFAMLRGNLWPFEPYGRETFIPWQRIRRMFRKKPNLRTVERKGIPDEMPREVVAQAQRRERAMTIGESRTPSHESARVDAQTAARVDALLAKISKDGLDALTPEERAFLKDSSPKYKRD